MKNTPEYIGGKSAALAAHVPRSTIYRWCQRYPDLSRVEAGVLIVNHEKLMKLALARATLREIK